MRFQYFLLFTLAVAFAGPAALAQDDDLAPIIEQVKKSLADVKSWSADMAMKMTMQGMTMEWTGDVTNSGGKSVTNMNMDMMGQKMAMRSIVDADGVSWSEINMGGMVQVMKMDAETLKAAEEMSAGMTGLPAAGGMGGGGGMDASKLVVQMLETYDLTLDGRDTLDGTEVYLITAVMKDELKEGLDPDGMMEQMGISLDMMRLAFGVEDGFVRRYEMVAADGTPFMSMTYTNLNLNAAVDDSLFEYTPPEGAIVQDMGEMMAAGPGGAAGGQFALGSPAPDFTGTSLAGDTVSLSDYKGKVVLLDFWATWCSPCIQELPNVIDAYKAYHDKGFEIVAISLDESKEDLEEFLKEHPDMTWVQLFDGKGWEADITMQYNVEAIPFTLLLDQEGNVVRQDLRGEALANALSDLLGG